MYYVLYEYSREMYACLCSPLLALAPSPNYKQMRAVDFAAFRECS